MQPVTVLVVAVPLDRETDAYAVVVKSRGQSRLLNVDAWQPLMQIAVDVAVDDV